MLYEKLKFGSTDYFEEIRERRQKYPKERLYIWGTGSVAAGVARRLADQGITVDGCFVNVKNYNTDSRIIALGLQVFLLDDLIKNGQSFCVIVGHSHYELAQELNQYPVISKTWCFTDIVRSDIEISDKFVIENIDQFENTYDRLSDLSSKQNMIAYLNAKLTKDASWILKDFDKSSTYFDNDVVNLTDHEVYLDLGAYDGSSIDEFIKNINNKGYEKYQIIAVEVQDEMVQLLSQKYSDNSRIHIICSGVSDHCGEDLFCFDDQSTCLDPERGIVKKVTTVDDICKPYGHISVMKICIGNTIIPLLSGAREIISRDIPKIVISAGIDKRALIDYIPYIDAIAGKGKYRFFLRFNNPMTESLVLFAIPNQNGYLKAI